MITDYDMKVCYIWKNNGAVFKK